MRALGDKLAFEICLEKNGNALKMDKLQKSFSKNELLNGLVLILVGLWVWWYTSAFPELPEGYPGPELFPRVIAAGLVLTGLLLVFTGKTTENDRASGLGSFSGKAMLRLLAGLIVVALYPFLQQWLAFIPALATTCFLMALLLRVKIVPALIAALSAAILIYGIFVKLLGVSL